MYYFYIYKDNNLFILVILTEYKDKKFITTFYNL